MMQQEFTIQRRSLDFEDYIDIVRRHKSWIFGPTLAALVISVVVACLWPDTFISTAQVRVVPSTIPERFVPNTINLDMTQRINNMSQTILSRANLTNIINTYSLYPKDIKRYPIEDIIEEMRTKHIRVGRVMNQAESDAARKGAGAFTIAFSYENRFISQKVCSELVSKFINESQRDTTDRDFQTNQFLVERVDEAKRQLDSIESALTVFRMQNPGKLPEDREFSLVQLNALQTRLMTIANQNSRINQDKLVLEAELARAKDQLAMIQSAPAEESTQERQAKNEQLMQSEREVQMLETQLASLRQELKPTHPDVRRVMGELSIRRKQRDDLMQKDQADRDARRASDAEQAKSKQSRPRQLSAQGQESQTIISRVKAQIEAKSVEMQDLSKEEASVKNQIGGIQGRIGTVPVNQQKYAELLRDYDRAREEYQSLSRKKQESALATQVTVRKQNESLEQLDSPSLPLTPTEPKRWIIIGAGTVLGLMFGIFLAGAREVKDTSLKNLKDVRAYTQLTILGCVPLLENDLVVRRRKRMAWLAWSTACLTSLFVMGGSLWYYLTSRG